MTQAKDVTVEKRYRPVCHLCDWAGSLHPDYQSANAERLAHLTWHSMREEPES